MPSAGCEANCDSVAWMALPAVVFLALTVSFTWCCCRRRQRYDSDNAEAEVIKTASSRQDAIRSTSTNNNGDVERAVGVKARIRAIEDGRVPSSGRSKSPPRRKHTPSNKAFEQFESSGIIIGMGGVGRRRIQHADNDDDDDERMPSVLEATEHTSEETRTSDDARKDDDIFGDVTRNTQVLKSFRKAPPPRKKGRVTKAPQNLQPEMRTLAPEPEWVNPEILHCDSPMTPQETSRETSRLASSQTNRYAANGTNNRQNSDRESSPLWCPRELHESQQRPISCDVTSTGVSSHKARLHGRMQRYTASPKTRRSQIAEDHMDSGIRKWQSERSSLNQITPTTNTTTNNTAKPGGVQVFTKQYPLETEI